MALMCYAYSTAPKPAESLEGMERGGVVEKLRNRVVRSNKRTAPLDGSRPGSDVPGGCRPVASGAAVVFVHCFADIFPALWEESSAS
jgi:hypothetical protein